MLRTVCGFLTLIAAAFAAQVVDGRIVNTATGAGMAGVNVLMGGEDVYRATTDGEGRFRIDGVRDGVYMVHYRARGYWPVPFNYGPEATVAVAAAGGPVHLEGKMQPVPKITGRVVDGAGRPVPNATVWALQNPAGCTPPRCFIPAAQTKTGQAGEYTLAEFSAPGRWVVAAVSPDSWDAPPAEGHRRMGWAQTFYPSVTDPQIAAKLMLGSGGDLTSIDIRLAAIPVHRIRGRVIGPRASVALVNGLGLSTRLETGADGRFEFRPVEDGDWGLIAAAESEGVKLWAGQMVRVKEQDIEDVEMRPAAPFTLRGKVVWEAPEGASLPAQNPDVILDYNGMPLNTPNAFRAPIGHIEENGDMKIEGVYPGPYHIAVLFIAPGSAPFYLDSIRLGGQDALADNVPIVSGDQPLTITYKFGGGTVRGTIEGCGAAHVILVPVETALKRAEFVRDTKCTSEGSFQFLNVRPGEYYGAALVAGEREWMGLVTEDEVLRQAGKITVRANEHTTAEIRLVK